MTDGAVIVVIVSLVMASGLMAIARKLDPFGGDW